MRERGGANGYSTINRRPGAIILDNTKENCGLWIGWPSLLSLYAFVIISLSSLQSLPNNIISPSTPATFNTCRLFPTAGLKWHNSAQIP